MQVKVAQRCHTQSLLTLWTRNQHSGGWDKVRIAHWESDHLTPKWQKFFSWELTSLVWWCTMRVSASVCQSANRQAHLSTSPRPPHHYNATLPATSTAGQQLMSSLHGSPALSHTQPLFLNLEKIELNFEFENKPNLKPLMSWHSYAKVFLKSCSVFWCTCFIH